ncbi:MAG TPA: zf-HC2 domain-containing protein [Candidatus Dormibacteraeota bacterium]|nr:zf-HC2 domain-containing protein [Candidatus Dormibacteraeota bacterium]
MHPGKEGRAISAPAPLACGRVRVLLEAYVDGDLERSDPASATAIRMHLATCADCRTQHAHAVSLPFRLKALTSPAPSQSLVADVLRSVAPSRRTYRRSWTLLAPEALLAAFILWYVSGIDGLTSLVSGMFLDLQRLAGWGAAGTSLPIVPAVDVLLLVALIALAAIAAYHISILARIESEISANSRPALGGRRRA